MRSFHISNDRLSVLYGLTQDDAPPPLPYRHLVNSMDSRSSSQPPHSSNGNEDENRYGTAVTENPEGVETQIKGKFRFKEKRKHQSDHGGGRGRERDRHHHDSSSSSKRSKHTHQLREVRDDPTAYDDTYIPNAASFKYANSDDAFRESLFDAMADDEGAAFWEGVYGQPINVYPRPEIKDRRGKLEKMDDEEYARYVREKMWEKSHQHIIEEREERERKSKERKERKRQDQKDRKQWEQAERTRLREDSQRRERRAKNRLRKRWDEYLEDWAIIMKGARVDSNDSERKNERPQCLIPWPVESGELSDISQNAVEQFFLAAPTGPGSGNGELSDILKLERVRWHPDKAQQRWGKGGIGEKEAKGITAVFQAIDSLWIEHKGKEARQV